jgi:hypothetical protein
MAMFHGVFCPPLIAAVAVAAMWSAGTPKIFPNHNGTVAVCFTTTALKFPETEPEAVGHPSPNFVERVERHLKDGVEPNDTLVRFELALFPPEVALYNVTALMAAVVLGMAAAPAKAAAFEEAWSCCKAK